MRLLHGDGDPTTPEGLRAIYAPPRLPWLRANMVSSLDGAATGSDGRSGTVNNAVDVDVFHVLRDLADAVLVGAFRPPSRPASGRIPSTRLASVLVGSVPPES
ncbi:dihydrofolate reductase family protein [Nocardioides sp. NPDC000441]|uniref:dihydrofolate reductase family protein n=1 Tax=Nocardioides sp. NPDC000441 TaxID=3154256 RepID=UPI00331F05C5